MPYVSEDLAYIAGFIDGEGSIIMQTRRDRDRDYIRPQLCITQCNKEILQWISITLGIRCNVIHERDKRRPGNKKAYYIRFGDRTAYQVIKIIRPYLRIKTKQADLLIKFYEEFKDRPNYSPEKLELARLNSNLNH